MSRRMFACCTISSYSTTIYSAESVYPEAERRHSRPNNGGVRSVFGSGGLLLKDRLKLICYAAKDRGSAIWGKMICITVI